MLGGLFSAFTGGGAGKKGAGIEQGFNQQGIDEIRRQFDVTSGLIQPYVDAGTAALPGLQSASTRQGLDQLLGKIFTSTTFQHMNDERMNAAEGALSAGGLTRSGTALQEAARIPAELGLMLEQLLTGRKQALATGGQNAAARLGAAGGSMANSIANLFNQSGKAGSSGAVTDAQSKASGLGSLVSTGLSIAGFFSDPRLKDNIEEIGMIGPLPLVQWDWKPETAGTVIETCPTMGFLTSDVKQHFPEFVSEYGGFEVLNYSGLLDRLEALN